MLQNTPKHRLRSIGDNWVCSCEHILRKFGTPKQCIRLRHTRFPTFFMQTVAKCSKILPNIVCGLLETIGCVRANIFYRSSVPRNIELGSDTPALHLFYANGSEMLQNTPIHRLWSIGDNWVCSCERILRKFGTSKQCIPPRNTFFASFFMQTIAKCRKTLPNIV